MKCRQCGMETNHCVLDLGCQPPSNAYIEADDIHKPEVHFPLRLILCTNCFLPQVEDVVKASDLFSPNYAYFSSYSQTWLSHAKNYVEMICARAELSESSFVIEIAANDGYLLQYFRAINIPCLGVEPTHETAAAARLKNIEIVQDFFGVKLAKSIITSHAQADLLVANNVLAHVPDLNDFIAGFKIILKENGVVTFEFQHVLELVRNNQFDTIYHEHYSYLSLFVVIQLLKRHGLKVFDVEKIDTHGGSLRVFAMHENCKKYSESRRVEDVLLEEEVSGVMSVEFYEKMASQAKDVAISLIDFLSGVVCSGKKVAAYGAAAKGNTLLNYSGINRLLLPYVIDKNPNKQGKYLPGSRIPILSEAKLRADRPDFIVILPWNIKDEILNQLCYVADWGGKLVTFNPKLELF